MGEPQTYRFVGIDPGMDGAYAIIEKKEDWLHVRVERMQFQVLKNDRKEKKDLDLVGMACRIATPTPRLVVIEDVHSMPGQGVSSTFKFGQGFGELLGMIKVCRWYYKRVAPQTWKRAILGKGKHTKEDAIIWVQNNYPQVNLVFPGCRVPHDGAAEALCMAEYAMRLWDKEMKECGTQLRSIPAISSSTS